MHNDKKALAALAAGAMRVFETHRREWEGQHAGQIVAIDPDSGDFFMGSTLGAADDAAHKKYPDKWLYFVRIGSSGAEIALRTW